MAFEHITISTVGRADVIARLPELGLGHVNLAVSLTAADDVLRSQIMPINRVHDLAALKNALLGLDLRRAKRRVLVSYVLIAGVNADPADAERLAAWCDGLPVMVNIIPFNPIPGSDWKRPDDVAIEAFRTRLEALQVPVRRRTTKGDGVLAACGQLATAGRKGRPLPTDGS
jgi:23S rRNA (adenine2503-C2)-methyltransferase